MGDLAARLQASLGSATFRPYASDDLTGVALGGAAKNVYAIACGVVEGMGLGENARAALVVVSASNPRRVRIRAVPASQGLGMTNAPGRSWRAWNRLAFSA